jgi:putative transposase
MAKLAQKVLQQQQGEIPLAELLRCRIRYFTDGGILGSRAFVQEQFARCKQIVSPSQSDRGYRLRIIAEDQIWALRNLRLRPVQFLAVYNLFLRPPASFLSSNEDT